MFNNLFSSGFINEVVSASIAGFNPVHDEFSKHSPSLPHLNAMLMNQRVDSGKKALFHENYQEIRPLFSQAMASPKKIGRCLHCGFTHTVRHNHVAIVTI